MNGKTFNEMVMAKIRLGLIVKEFVYKSFITKDINKLKMTTGFVRNKDFKE